MGKRNSGEEERDATRDPDVGGNGHGPKLLVRLDKVAVGPPTRYYHGDAGYDLPCSQTVTIPPQGFVDVHTGIYVQLPPNTWGLIIGRSGALRRLNIHIQPGIVDNGYRGELLAGCYNLNDSRIPGEDKNVHILKGDRMFQMILMPLFTPSIEIVDHLEPSARGTRGFGSTGVSARELRG